MWLSLLLVLPLPRGFFSGFSGFPPSIKTNRSKFQFDRNLDTRPILIAVSTTEMVILFEYVITIIIIIIIIISIIVIVIAYVPRW